LHDTEESPLAQRYTAFTHQRSCERAIGSFLYSMDVDAISLLIYMWCCTQATLSGEWEVNSDLPDTSSFLSDWIPCPTGGKKLILKFSRLFLLLNW